MKQFIEKLRAWKKAYDVFPSMAADREFQEMLYGFTPSNDEGGVGKKWDKYFSQVDAHNNGFHQGMALALVALGIDNDQPTMAKNIAIGYGLGINDFKDKGIDPMDIEKLKRFLPKESPITNLKIHPTPKPTEEGLRKELQDIKDLYCKCDQKRAALFIELEQLKKDYSECYAVKEKAFLVARDADSSQKAAMAKCKEVIELNKELNYLFELQHKITLKADALWQKETGKIDTLPNLKDLIEWLMVRREKFPVNYPCLKCGEKCNDEKIWKNCKELELFHRRYPRAVEVEPLEEPHINFSDRKKLAWSFGIWADENKASYIPENVIAWALSVGIIDKSKAREWLNKQEEKK